MLRSSLSPDITTSNVRGFSCGYLVQVLSREGKVFLRITDDRGWTYAQDPDNSRILFEMVEGDVTEDT